MIYFRYKYNIMPKSKEYIDSSDSEEAKNLNNNDLGSDEETPKASASKKSKAKTKDDVRKMNSLYQIYF